MRVQRSVLPRCANWRCAKRALDTHDAARESWNPRRLADHFGGKVHLGYLRIREMVKTLREKREKAHPGGSDYHRCVGGVRTARPACPLRRA